MSLQEALKENNDLKQENAHLKSELDRMKKLIFGSKKERFTSEENPLQLSLFNTGEETTKEVQVLDKQRITYERKTPKPHPGRNEIPDHLPVQEVVIEPEEDTTCLVKIGEERTETLEYTPASLVKKITIRPKYAKKDGEGVLIGKLPSRPIEKGIAEASLLAHIIVSKLVDHLPFYRQIEIFKRDFRWEVNSSTINDWFVSCCTLIKPLYDVLEQQVLKSGYIQADESPIRVLDKDKEGSSHQGYMWVFHNPGLKTVLFKYSKGRGDQLVKQLLQGYEGIVQCDGYAAYDKLPIINPKIKLAGCLAHVRRKFYEAQANDKQRSEYALAKIQKIYALEKIAKELDHDQRKQYRNDQVRPILNDMKSFAEKASLEVTPKSQIGKAVGYLLSQMHKMESILDHGNVEMDNNLIENKIRPLALGRKNYMFAGSHDGAERLAMMYSFMATCKANGINPYEWLKETLDQIAEMKLSDLDKMLPGNM